MASCRQLLYLPRAISLLCLGFQLNICRDEEGQERIFSGGTTQPQQEAAASPPAPPLSCTHRPGLPGHPGPFEDQGNKINGPGEAGRSEAENETLAAQGGKHALR